MSVLRRLGVAAAVVGGWLVAFTIVGTACLLLVGVIAISAAESVGLLS